MNTLNSNIQSHLKMADKATDKTKAQKSQHKINARILKNIETICITTGSLSLGGFLSGALFEDEKLALISGATGVISTLIGFYANNKQKEQDDSNTKYNNNTYNNKFEDNYKK